MMPELDSHHSSQEHPDPLGERFSPWHAAGPKASYKEYSAGMRRHADLHLLSAVLRLAPGDKDVAGAAKQWERLFGVKRVNDTEVGFTNAKMGFVEGKEGMNEGLVEIMIGVEGRERLKGILERAKKEGLVFDGEKRVEMLGLKWRFILVGRSEGGSSRL
jgi:hypothetical protein